MSENINQAPPLSNELAALAEDVKHALAEADHHERLMAERTLDAGHMLCKAKEASKHGDWLPFLMRAGINERKAQRLMKLARHGFKSDIVSLLGGVAPALRHASRPMPGPGKALCVSTSDDNSISVVFVAASDKHPGFYNIVGVTQNADGTLETQLLKRPILGEWTGSGLNWVWFLVCNWLGTDDVDCSEIPIDVAKEGIAAAGCEWDHFTIDESTAALEMFWKDELFFPANPQ